MPMRVTSSYNPIPGFQGGIVSTLQSQLLRKMTWINPKATERWIKVRNQVLFSFSFKTAEFLVDVLCCNSLALAQRKYT